MLRRYEVAAAAVVYRYLADHQAKLLVTDEWVGYRGLDDEYVHAVIMHTAGDYVSGAAQTNTIEGFWSMQALAQMRGLSATVLHFIDFNNAIARGMLNDLTFAAYRSRCSINHAVFWVTPRSRAS